MWGVMPWWGIVRHTWMHAFGVPAGMRAVPMAGIEPRPWVGVVTTDQQPVSIVAAALLEAIADLDVARCLDRASAAALHL